jgi:hypothetical protein
MSWRSYFGIVRSTRRTASANPLVRSEAVARIPRPASGREVRIPGQRDRRATAWS